MLTKGNAPTAKAVGVTGKLRLVIFAVPVALPALPEWSAAISAMEAARG